jgi:diguanylate cyclase (GGDEF)-like protein/PAS domain S-box-containing protein
MPIPIESSLEPAIANLILANAREAIVITDAAGDILRANPAYCSLTGYSPEELIGKNQRILNSGRHDRSFFQAMWHALQNEGRWTGKIWNRRKDGSLFLEILNIVALHDAGGTATHYVGFFSDITQEGLDADLLGQLAFYDPLTGLPTGPLLLDLLYEPARHCDRTGRHVALFYLNLDAFTALNRAHGHTVGDALIKAYAERLEAIVRQDDTVVRPGGDEFAVILREMATPQDVPQLAEKLMRQISEPFVHNGQSIVATASMGVSLYPDHSNDLEQLVGLAKQAMLQAKAAGKDRWVMHTKKPKTNGQ